MPASAAPGTTYRAVLRHRAFRGLFCAQLLSLVADRLAAVALTVLVFRETSSALLAGATYAATLLPWLVSGLLLSAVADRASRRTVMVRADLARALLVGLMVVPGVPLWALLALLVASGLLAPVFEAARAAVLPGLLDGEEYVVAASLSMAAFQVAQLVGLAAAGVVVERLGVRLVLGLDAVTFALSALVVAAVLVPGAGDAEPGERPPYGRDLLAGVRHVFGSPVLRSLLLLAWLVAAVLVVPEGLAVVLVQERGAEPVWTGVLMATVPAGMALGAVLVGRAVRPELRPRTLLPLAAVALLPLLLTPAVGGLPAVGLLWLLAGVGGAYQMTANAVFMRAVPDTHRARAFGVAQSGMLALQGLVLLVAGAAADRLGPAPAVAVLAACAVPAALLLARSWPADELLEAAGVARPVPSGSVPIGQPSP